VTRRWVVNASPLILLAKIDSLFLLEQLAAEVVVPLAVRGEVIAGLTSYPIEFPSWLILRDDLPLPAEIAGWDLGAGESQVLAHALTSGYEAVLDDLQGRRCARALGVLTTGSLGVILRAKRQGIIPAARPLVENLLLKGMYLSRELAEMALREVGE
jgi:predicted nucleic acid-binding protein